MKWGLVWPQFVYSKYIRVIVEKRQLDNANKKWKKLKYEKSQTKMVVWKGFSLKEQELIFKILSSSLC